MVESQEVKEWSEDLKCWVSICGTCKGLVLWASGFAHICSKNKESQHDQDG